MPTNQEILDLGQPTPTDPPAITNAILRYGNALIGVFGPEVNPTDFGTYLKRIPTILTGLAVSGGTVTLAVPGIVTAAQITAGGTGTVGPGVRVVTGTLSGSQYRVAYDATTGLATLTFVGTVTQCAVEVLAIPQGLIDHLNAEATPEDP